MTGLGANIVDNIAFGACGLIGTFGFREDEIEITPVAL